MTKNIFPSRPLLILIAVITFSASKAQLDTSLYSSLQWRSIGPYRGGRTVGAAGVPQRPNVFYIGVNDGGVWKTTDYGRTWVPIFDDQSTGSIGAIAVAPSDPEIIYVGSGEGLHRPDLSTGNGLYKSSDGGKSWVHLGLQEGQQIPKIAVDPKNPERVFVAVLGHPYGPNTERGIFRSLDGGKSFEKILFVDENTGGDDVAIDPNNPDVIFATLWQSREGPWENGEWAGTNGGVFKSTDGGTTWKKLTKDLPKNMAQAHIALAPSAPNVMYVAVGTTEANEYGTGSGMGLYRSDDAGDNWHEITEDGRPEARIGGGDAPEIMVDPKDPETLYTTSIVVWKSTDGGKKWTGIRGAPGGDDYQNIWINPANTSVMLVTSDQGAIITVNGGDTWSSWYNQPTAQLYHVTADNEFPYNVYSGQQESGSVGIASRGNDGQVNFRDWHSVGAEEYGYVVADPLNANIIYGGKISKYNKLTGQVQNIRPEDPRQGAYRFVRTEPIVFSPLDPKTLYFAGNVLFKTRDGGSNWQVISPDLTRQRWDIPASVGIYNTDALKKMPRRGVIYTVAPSPLNINTIWAGTDDGFIHLTKDGGKNWSNVTPPEITSWSKISLMEASHYDANTAFAAVNRLRCDDRHPYIYMTRDGGRTWASIVNGLPNDPINAIREDPKKKGLLFATSETQVFTSFDEGGHWQSLRLNMPATSVRDLIVKNNDLVVATHGRGFWILDDISPLRQMTDQIAPTTTLFKPASGLRIRWNLNTDTPIPPDEPAGQNPPDGAIIDYYLQQEATGGVILDIVDNKGTLVRRCSSSDTLYKIPEVDIPLYWIRPQVTLSNQAGAHRFIWDLHYTPLNIPPSYPIAAAYKNTAPEPTGPWVAPGTYTVKLSVNGQTFSQPLTITMDPRVTTPITDLHKQLEASLECYEARQQITNSVKEITLVHGQVKDRITHAKGALLTSLKNVDEKISALEKPKQPDQLKGYSEVYNSFSGLFRRLQETDMVPENRLLTAVKESAANLKMLNTTWHTVRTDDLPAINKDLIKEGLPSITL